MLKMKMKNLKKMKIIMKKGKKIKERRKTKMMMKKV